MRTKAIEHCDNTVLNSTVVIIIDSRSSDGRNEQSQAKDQALQAAICSSTHFERLKRSKQNEKLMRPKTQYGIR